MHRVRQLDAGWRIHSLLSVSVLASGSSGNAIYISTEQTRLLLDAGISGKQISQRLATACQVDGSQITAVLVTHEHVDHVRGLKQILKLSQAPLYTTEGTYAEIVSGISGNHIHKVVRAGEVFSIGDIRITPFAVSHDAEEPVAYRFDAGDESLAVVTDLGFVSDSIKDVIAGCDTYVFESNHDVEMLRAGPYPWSIKRRILGDKGHLSNTDAAEALIDIIGQQEVKVYLAHLSEENNQPDLADLTVSSILQEARSTYQEQVSLLRTSRYEPTILTPVSAKCNA
ncbi:phosphoribosyl 1,2-cyclic phosphodiesterase [Alicyclobacillus tengchongensis]|uniref:Phosphoribosyl 1,2-cyclic phosphodiesterase n=1 Tax=Alicyclobacillus tolerans TaxID=90970 RepID=A0ABT9LUE0_9BACL|nr:MBL fold metallo-hydrolase [Alicyclobacillus montanus]MDP9727873.1 phosphoribosyl 1,2-cyclic phosphodiesterase [Alicyclobacillus tengchongensis]